MNPKKLELIAKHGKKFAAKSAVTPILSGVHYATDGSAIICDRVKLLRLRDVHSNTVAETRCLTTGALIDGTYPETSKLFPEGLTCSVRIDGDNVKTLAAVCKAAVDIAKGAGEAQPLVTIGGEFLRYCCGTKEAEINAALGVLVAPHDEVALNPAFVLDALNVFKDAGAGEVDVCITGAHVPVVFYDIKTGIDVLMMPYRRPSGN